MRAALAALVLLQAASVAPRPERRTVQRRLRHRRRWRASRRASRRSPFTTHTKLPDARNCSWKILTQKLDHFGSIEKTFDQRLCLFDGFAKNVTRVLLYVGNESPVDEYVNNTGLMWELGEQLGALLVFAEHRYEPLSHPALCGLGSQRCFAYCTTAQAIADWVTIIASPTPTFRASGNT